MLKMLGILSVFFPCLFWGAFKSYRLKKRCDSLGSLRLAAERLGVEISFTKKRLERIFTEVARDFSLPIFFDAAVGAKELGLRSAWEESLEKYSEEMALAATDIKALRALGDIAGYSGEEQQRCIRSLLRLLELSEKEAGQIYERQGKLCRSSGILIGLLAVILLI